MGRSYISVADIIAEARKGDIPISIKFSSGCGAHLDDCMVSIRYLRRRELVAPRKVEL